MPTADPPHDLISVDSLPPLPVTAAKLLQLAADPDVDIDALTRVIEGDPPLSARILGIANSAFYAPRRPVLTVKAAIVGVLGLNMVRNMAFGMALTGGLSTAECPRFDLAGYRVLSLGTADLASGLARGSTATPAPDPDMAYLVGLLHNLGELLLVHLWPREMGQVLAECGQESDGMAARERSFIGIDHYAAGAALVRHWGLPDAVSDRIAQLADINTGTGDPLVRLVGVSRDWLAGLLTGNVVSLRVADVDDTYCEYRATRFHDRLGALATLARSIG